MISEMSHYADHEWRLYVRGGLPERRTAEMEAHLAACDACLEAYMQAAEEAPLTLPPAVEDGTVVDAAMKRLQQADATRKAARRTKQRLLHYAAAAAATFLLTVSGAFDLVASDWTDRLPKADREPISAKIMEKTLSILDDIGSSDKGGVTR
jgi:anti-sigma factor RsiW